MAGLKETSACAIIGEAFTPNNVLRRPDHFNLATDIVDLWAAKPQSLEAMFWISPDTKTQKSLSYSRFSRQLRRIAVLLQQPGGPPGDVMMPALPRLPACPRSPKQEVGTAGLCSGVVTAPATTLVTAMDIKHRCQKSKATIFVGDAISVAKAQQIRHLCHSLRVIIQVDGTLEPGVIGL